MQEINKHLVSIIIPCYNAEKFITETIKSILDQTYKHIETIIIDDGSTDNSKNEIDKLTEYPIQYTYQPNQGVSAARNFGLSLAKGEYVLFLDADDILESKFIESRLLNLNNSDFSFGSVQELNKLKNGGFWSNESEDLLKDILLFNSKINTCPSGFLFNKAFLLSNSISFNIKLQSTADKFFLLETLLAGGKYSYIGNIDDANLKYRVHESSMSHMLTEGLIADNKKYFEFVKQLKNIPKELKKEFNFKMTYILCGANKKINNWKSTCYYLIYLLLFFPRKSIVYLFTIKN